MNTSNTRQGYLCARLLVSLTVYCVLMTAGHHYVICDRCWWCVYATNKGNQPGTCK